MIKGEIFKQKYNINSSLPDYFNSVRKVGMLLGSSDHVKICQIDTPPLLFFLWLTLLTWDIFMEEN